MSSQQSNFISDRYVEAAGESADGRYRLGSDELLWLIDHATALSALRLELLQAVQSALSGSDAEGEVAELKDMLTNLIIMQSRLAGRDQQLIALLANVADSDNLNSVAADRTHLADAVTQMLQGSDHVSSVAGE